MAGGWPITPQELARAKEVLGENPGIGRPTLAKLLGISHGRAYSILLHLSRGEAGTTTTDRPDNAEESHELSGDSWTISLPRTRIKSLDELVKACSIDLNVWEVERFVANKWEVGAKDNDGKLQIEPLHQVKAWLKKKVYKIAVADEIADLLKDAKKKIPKPPALKLRPAQSGNMLEISIPDLHMGKLAWSKETGWGDYDTRIAKGLFEEATEVLLSRVSHYDLDEIWLIHGNDLLNADNSQGTTTRGTPQNTDSRYEKVFAETRQMICEQILKVRKLAKKKRVVMVRGNHDYQSVFCLGDSLQCYFHTYEDIEIDNTPKPRKYHQFGHVLLGFTHGHQGKLQDYPSYMSAEVPHLFASTWWREFHTGHLHKRGMILDEKNGTCVRILTSLCEADAYHSESGFVGNIRSAECFVWNRDEGLIGSATYSPIGRAR
jgi:predicted phosphodiesterase